MSVGSHRAAPRLQVPPGGARAAPLAPDLRQGGEGARPPLPALRGAPHLRVPGKEGPPTGWRGVAY